jgi:hemoglobin-like flavoprotein
MGAEITQVQESFGRATVSGQLIDKFYEIFLNSHPDVKPRFAKTDFVQQKKLLRRGISLAIMFADNNPVGRDGIARIRESHSKARLNIPPSLYKYWLESFIKALSLCDQQFGPQLELLWRKTLQKTIDFVVEGYESPAARTATHVA